VTAFGPDLRHTRAEHERGERYLDYRCPACGERYEVLCREDTGLWEPVREARCPECNTRTGVEDRL
jgi:DNA-directed RNA polymerase subunit RPC12/RpoP